MCGNIRLYGRVFSTTEAPEKMPCETRIGFMMNRHGER